MVNKDVIHQSKTALLIVDMINPLQFPEGQLLLEQAQPIAAKIAELKKQLKKKRIPIIYGNDNFGHWKSDWKSLYKESQKKDFLGKPLARPLEPDDDDYFVLKPKHSAFYCTALDIMLGQIGVKKLIITGVATDICILFSVYDAYNRGYKIVVPEDCTAAETPEQKGLALQYMKKTFGIRTSSSGLLKI